MEPQTSFCYQPIAIFKSSHQETYEAPRQGVLATGAFGWFELTDAFSQDAIEDLLGFDRLWLIYDFHQNKTWKPKVRPPRFSEKKRSVFSTRSPYRPNSIGMSCVRILKIEGKKVFVSEHDLLDGSPILDIKPYLPYADAFVGAQTGWVKLSAGYELDFENATSKKVLWLEEKLKISFRQILTNQLAFEPTNANAKRVKKVDSHFVFSIRTWRFAFKLKSEAGVDKVKIFDIYSGYSELEMADQSDPHSDKAAHKKFSIFFNHL